MTLKCEKGIKTLNGKIFRAQSIRPFLFCLYLLPAPDCIAMTVLTAKATALRSQYQLKHTVCTFACRLTDPRISMKITQSSSSSSQLCCLKALPVTRNLRVRPLTRDCAFSSRNVQVGVGLYKSAAPKVRMRVCATVCK